MISNSKALHDIEQQWTAVKSLCAGSHRQWMFPGGQYINETPLESSYNLPFFLAYAVLEQVLVELIDQGTISCKKNKKVTLAIGMEASKEALPWKAYELVDCGRNERNKLAHEARLLSKAECFKFIDAIEHELKAWKVL